MSRKFVVLVLILIVTILTGNLLAENTSNSWESIEKTSRIIYFENVTHETIEALAGASQRLIIDTEQNSALAEIPLQSISKVTRFQHSVLSETSSEEIYRQAVIAYYPQFRLEKSGNNRYMSKLPASTKPSENSPAPQPKTNGNETSCLYEGFEYYPVWYEDGGDWYHYEYGYGNNEGYYYWIDDTCDAYSGAWQVDAVLGGWWGYYLYCMDTYDYYTDSDLMYSWVIDCAYLQASSSISFGLKMYSEQDYDFFGVYFSVYPYSDYYGYVYSGNWAAYWYAVSGNMRAWYYLGDLAYYSGLGLLFNFNSDYAVNSGFGTYLDEISIDVSNVSISSVSKVGNPFRLRVYGTNFLPGAWIYINGYGVPNTTYKSSTYLLAKKGSALKSMCPVGVPVCVQVQNPGGDTSGCLWYTRY